MVQMRMCEHNSIDGYRVRPQGRPVEEALLFNTLEESAVDEDFFLI